MAAQYLSDPAVRAAAVAEVQHGIAAQHAVIPSVARHLTVSLGNPLGQSGPRPSG